VLDLVTTSSDGYVSMLLGSGDGTFQTARSFAMDGAGSANAIDVNADGRLELVVTNRSSAGQHLVHVYGQPLGRIRPAGHGLVPHRQWHRDVGQ
jgi:hypothetical protein